MKIKSESITLPSADPARGFTTGINVDNNLNADYVLITCMSGAISFTYDGVTTPSGSVGHILSAPQSISLSGYDQIKNFKMKAASDSVLYCSFEIKEPVIGNETRFAGEKYKFSLP